MSQVSDYRRESAQLIGEAHTLLQQGFDIVNQQPEPDPALLAVLNALTKHIDLMETDANIRNDNYEDAEIVIGRLRKQRDGSYHKQQGVLRWLKQVQEQLARYQAHYPEPPRATPRAEPTVPPTPRKASEKPIQQAFDFTEPPTEPPNE